MSITQPITRPIATPIARGVAGAGVGGFSPLQLPALRAWWEINDLTTLFTTAAGNIPASEGSLVGRIEDKSGNGKHITFLDARRPYLRRDANGVYYLEGDGTRRSGSVAGSAAYFKFLHDGTGASFCCVAALDDAATPSASRIIFHTNGATTLAGAGAQLVTSSGGLGQVLVRIGNGSAYVVNASSAVGEFRSDGRPQTIVETYKTQTGSDARIYIDGSQFNASGYAEANTPSSGNPNNDLTLFTTNSSSYFRGKFYGLIISAAEWTAAERQAVSRYALRLQSDVSYALGAGDSFTYNLTYGQSQRDFYPAKLETLLDGEGIRYASVNKGISENSTLNVIARLSSVAEAGRGAVAVIYCGTNDRNGDSTVQASPSPTASTFRVASGKGTLYAAGGQITVNGEAATVQSVSTDAITLTAPLSFTPTAGQAVVISTRPNLVTIGNYLRSAGYSRLIVCGQHYLNFATGGDTVATPLAGNVALRALQSGAASDLGALYVDFHAYMRQLIVAGTYTQGDDLAWHVLVGNTHLNNTGEQILADAIFAAMQAQGWA